MTLNTKQPTTLPPACTASSVSYIATLPPTPITPLTLQGLTTFALGKYSPPQPPDKSYKEAYESTYEKLTNNAVA